MTQGSPLEKQLPAPAGNSRPGQGRCRNGRSAPPGGGQPGGCRYSVRAVQDEQATHVWRRCRAEDHLRHCELCLAETNNRLAEAWQRRNTAEDSAMQWGVAETLAVERGFAATTRPRRERRRTAEAVAAEPAPAEAVAAEAAVAE